MKICWDNLEKLRYNKRTGKWYKENGKGNSIWIYKECCKECGESFLAKMGLKGEYCCCLCMRKHTSIKTRQKMSNSQKGRKGKNSSKWDGGYHRNNIPKYDTYAHQIEWCEEVRRNKEDRNILEVKCTYCGKWYIPDLKNVVYRKRALEGQLRGELRFYCSEGCKQACPIYHKKPEQLMKEDAIRAGRLGWLELNREVQPELRKIVLERDGYECMKCGSTGPLHCHHIYPVSTNPLLSADVDNCITYCIDCHKEAHQKDGCRLGELRMEIC